MKQHAQPAKAVRYGWAIWAAPIVALGLASELARPANWDVAWLVYVAQELTRGAHLYTDLAEINPPLAVWLDFPAALAERWLGVPALLANRIGVACICVLALALWQALRPSMAADRAWRRNAAAMLLAALLFLWTRAHFGQREHLAFALVLPASAAVARRRDGPSAPRALRHAAGLLAAVGIALKPYFALVWAALALLSWRWTAGKRERLGPELFWTPAFAAIYIAAFAFLGLPAYLDLVHRLGGTYWGWEHRSLSRLFAEGPELVFACLALLAYAAARNNVARTGLTDATAAVTAGFFAAALVQAKGFNYHYYPVSAGATLLLGFVALDPRRAARLSGCVAVAVARVGAVVVPASAAVWAIAGMTTPHPMAEEIAALAPTLRAYAADGPVLRLSGRFNFPLVNESGARWASRFPMLWFVQALYPDAVHSGRPPVFRPAATLPAAERYCIQAVVSDWARYRPGIVLVPTPMPGREENGHSPYDYLAFLARDPRFPALIARYRRGADVAGYRVYVRGT